MSDPDSNSNKSQLPPGCSIRRISKAPKLKGRSTDLPRMNRRIHSVNGRSRVRRLFAQCKSHFTVAPRSASAERIRYGSIRCPIQSARGKINGLLKPLNLTRVISPKREGTFFAGWQPTAFPSHPPSLPPPPAPRSPTDPFVDTPIRYRDIAFAQLRTRRSGRTRKDL